MTIQQKIATIRNSYRQSHLDGVKMQDLKRMVNATARYQGIDIRKFAKDHGLDLRCKINWFVLSDMMGYLRDQISGYLAA